MQLSSHTRYGFKPYTQRRFSSLSSETKDGSEMQCCLREVTNKFNKLPEEVYGKFRNANLLSKQGLTSFHMTTKSMHMSNTLKQT